MARRFSPQHLWATWLSLAVAASFAGCRGNISEDPPVHLQQNMALQPRFEAQQSNAFFADGRAMRPPPLHTIAMGELRDSDHLYRGRIDGKLATHLPMPLTRQLLQRGRERYDIYCAVCHGATGDGRSMLMTRKMLVPPPSYLEPRLRAEPVGYFFEVISQGVRNMPAYAAQLPVNDRWAIAAYVRALQIAGHAPLAQVPPEVATAKGWRAIP